MSLYDDIRIEGVEDSGGRKLARLAAAIAPALFGACGAVLLGFAALFVDLRQLSITGVPFSPGRSVPEFDSG